MKPIYLCGPTAVGKSAVAIELARRLNGEIISVDSMQVYRGLDIGTAKPANAERAKITHHLIDVVGLNEGFDAAAFVRLAKSAETEITSRHRRVIYCGGTGLYFNALLFGLGETPPGDPQVRAKLEGADLADLLQELRAKDPALFETIDRNNPRRIIRALEVIRLTGRPYSEQRAGWQQAPAEPLLGLEMDQAQLHSRINRRVEVMFAAGLIEETKGLLKLGLRENRTAAQALGYKQVIEHLDGVRGLSETVELVKLRTRQFAKRQLTWFKRQLPVLWTRAGENESPCSIAERLIDIHKLV